MCKLFCVLDVENQNQIEKFIETAVPHVTRTDNHGLGIMRLGETGVHIQRWLDIPNKLVTTPTVNSPYLQAMRIVSNEVGVKPKKLKAVAIHGRMATCGISLENTHPFYLHGSALMHNGILSNLKPEDNIISSCDSETLLHRYIDNGVKEDPTQLTNAMSDVSGYYATMVFNDDGIVDIWRDETATLFIAKVENIGTVLATTPELIYKTAKKTKHRVLYCYPMLEFTHIRWESGKIPQITSFEKVTSFVSTLDKDVEYYGKHSLDKSDFKGQTESWWRQEEREEAIRNMKGI